MFWLEAAIGIGVISVWAPLSAAMGIVFPWMNIIFMVAWVIFWMSPVGKRQEAKLLGFINRNRG
jgi:hypothetical protein